RVRRLARVGRFVTRRRGFARGEELRFGFRLARVALGAVRLAELVAGILGGGRRRRPLAELYAACAPRALGGEQLRVRRRLALDRVDDERHVQRRQDLRFLERVGRERDPEDDDAVGQRR